ncbi:hypothetical protein SAMN05421780_108193 [Flexibacter flexilis DSM 6793]|uniref:Uncharacterized protein n=1 Tax=Flexibacter flexilis DSM 6793 TaxID=927664 RepID=A0A1I1LE24_9BACT|nr:hypothetical protein [Flexibacter flexilis]SFC71344.1 hypothetical protein SAMN05421780_108193 [Flexibacter flexilis DSM 6793]
MSSRANEPENFGKPAKQRSDEDDIIEFLRTGNGELSDKQKKLFDIYDFADNQIRNLVKESEVVNMLMLKYGVKRATAYRYISKTKQIFGSINRSEKEFWRRLVIEQCFDSIKLSKSLRDPKGLNGAIAQLIKATNLNEVDIDMPDFAALEPHTYELVLNDFSVSMMQSLMQAGAVNLVGMMANELNKSQPIPIPITPSHDSESTDHSQV